FSDSPEALGQAKASFEFAVAQSIFSHCGLDLIANWLSAISQSLAENGALVATFLPGEEDSQTKGWVYPECVNYKPATIRQVAADAGPVCRAEVLFNLAKKQPAELECGTGATARKEESCNCPAASRTGPGRFLARGRAYLRSRWPAFDS